MLLSLVFSTFAALAVKGVRIIQVTNKRLKIVVNRFIGTHPFFFDFKIKYPTPINAITAKTIEILIRMSNKNSTEIGSDVVITCEGKSTPPV